MPAQQREELFVRLDREIKESLLEFVRCGRALKEMRDSQAYVDHYGTFEEYVKATEGMTISDAQRTIQASLVHDCLGRENCGPKTRSQCNALQHAVVFVDEKRTITGPSGKERTIKQPVAVKNAKQIQKIWATVQKDYEQQRERDQAEGKPVRKLTSGFIIDRLPNDKKPQHIFKRRESNTATQLIGAIASPVKVIETRNLSMEGRLKSIAQTEEWTNGIWMQLRDIIIDCRDLLDAVMQEIDRNV